MKYYAAIVSEEELKAPEVIPPVCILCSYYYFKNKIDLIKLCLNKGYDVFIDSGAFSAMNSGKIIDIDEYCKYILETKAGLYAGLDVIGDAKKTRENCEYMINQYGLSPIPTFHLGGNLNDFYAMLEKDYSYIALGGLAFGAGNTTRYCDEIWNIILKKKPELRVHGFAMTNFELMERYPWYSVDSSSYKGGRRYGRIQMLWNGFNFKTFQEDEFVEHLRLMGVAVDTMDNKTRWFLYDFYSVQAYKLWAEHLREVNKIKDFSYLTAQNKLF